MTGSAVVGITFVTLVSVELSEYAHVRASLMGQERSISDTGPDLILVGDVLLARDVERKMVEYGADYPFSHVRDHLAAAVVVGNFEASVPKVHIPTPDFAMQFSVMRENLSALHEAGFTHVSLANNHADDFGAEGYYETRRALTTAGISSFGIPYVLATSSVAVVTAGETRVALIGIYAVDIAPSSEMIIKTMQYASKVSDVQIAYVHWGDEYQSVHNAVQEQLARALIDAGADMVVGHHPHVVQDIELYRDALIFYSLGNFVFDQYFNREVQQGLLLALTFRDGGSISVDLTPVSSELSRTAPRVLSGFERDRFLVKLGIISDTELKTAIENGVLNASAASRSAE